jgi:excinuclease UvrABC helicase subunit UvrB
MKNWLSQKSFREIRVQHHVNGVRVTLYEDFEEIISRINDTVDQSFSDCIKEFDICLLRHYQQKKERLEKNKNDAEQELEKTTKNLKQLSILICGLTKKKPKLI